MRQMFNAVWIGISCSPSCFSKLFNVVWSPSVLIGLWSFLLGKPVALWMKHCLYEVNIPKKTLRGWLQCVTAV